MYNQIYPNEKSFVIVGSGPLLQKLKDFSKRYDNVFPLGYVENELLKDLYASAICFLFPTKMEAFPFSLLEALSSGLPIITSPVGGIPDLFKQKLDIGIMIRNWNDYRNIVNNIHDLIDNSKNLKQIQKNCRQLAERKYSWDIIGNEILKEYYKCLDSK